jgi:hypothetical protein
MRFGHFRNSSVGTFGSMRLIPRSALAASTVAHRRASSKIHPLRPDVTDAHQFQAKRRWVQPPTSSARVWSDRSCKPDGWATPRWLAAVRRIVVLTGAEAYSRSTKPSSLLERPVWRSLRKEHGLRPHLTRWQARFGRWYANELERKVANWLSICKKSSVSSQNTRN